MGYSENSISNTFSKISTDEEMSIFRASLEDAAKRLADGAGQGSISNEEIGKNDMLLETYRCTEPTQVSSAQSGFPLRRNAYGDPPADQQRTFINSPGLFLIQRT